MGIPEYEAKRYEGRVRHGGILLSVHCDNSEWVKRAEDLLKRSGAEDVSSTSEAAADFGKSDKPLPRTRTSIIEEPVEAGGNLNDTAEIEYDATKPPRFRTTGGSILDK